MKLELSCLCGAAFACEIGEIYKEEASAEAEKWLNRHAKCLDAACNAGQPAAPHFAGPLTTADEFYRQVAYSDRMDMDKMYSTFKKQLWDALVALHLPAEPGEPVYERMETTGLSVLVDAACKNLKRLANAQPEQCGSKPDRKLMFLAMLLATGGANELNETEVENMPIDKLLGMATAAFKELQQINKQAKKQAEGWRFPQLGAAMEIVKLGQLPYIPTLSEAWLKVGAIGKVVCWGSVLLDSSKDFYSHCIPSAILRFNNDQATDISVPAEWLKPVTQETKTTP